jgi:hypothetical protein
MQHFRTLSEDTEIPLDYSMIEDVRATEDICNLMQALGAVRKDTLLENTDSCIRKKAWYFLQGTLTVTLQEKAHKLKSLLNSTPKVLFFFCVKSLQLKTIGITRITFIFWNVCVSSVF